MFSHVDARGRVHLGPVRGDEPHADMLAFVLLDEPFSLCPAVNPGAAATCEVICRGAVADRVGEWLAEGDAVVVRGVLNVSRPPGYEDSDLCIVRLEATSVSRAT